MKIPVFFSIVVVLVSCHSRQEADLILFHGKIYTVDRVFTKAEAVAVKDGKILAVGSDADIRGSWIAADTVDLGGKAVYPGLIDAHGHFVEYGNSLSCGG